MSATRGPLVDVVMPRLGESIVEGTVVRWAVEPGQRVERGQLLAEVETDKATADLPASIDGVVDTLLVEEGTTVEVGQTVARLRPAGGASDDAALETARATEASAARPSRDAVRPREPSAGAAASGRLPPRRLAPQPVGDGDGPRRTSPAVRRLAREHDVDLHGLAGSGHRGRVTRDDVLAAIQQRSGSSQSELTRSAARVAPMTLAPSPDAPGFRAPRYRPGPRDRVEPLGRRRHRITQHLRHSLQTAVHVATVAEIDMHGVFSARDIDAVHCEQQGVRLTVLSYVVQAVARTLSDVPLLNATLQDDLVIHRAERNVGVAVDTPAGVIVPVLRRADELGLLGVARAIEDLSKRARDGAITADDLADGSFTISNPGREGNLFGISIIRQPEVGILRIGSVVKRPVVQTVGGQDAIVIRPMMYAALSYDHRVIDGRTGNAFLYRLAERLEAVKPAFGPPK